MKILVTSPIDAEAIQLLQEHAVVEMLEIYTKKHLMDRIHDIDILLLRGKSGEVKIDREIMDCAKKLKLIARHGAGFDHVDVVYATQKGILFSAATGSNAVAVAEYTFGLLLILIRRYFEIATAVKGGSFDRARVRGNELRDKTMGIIGMGHIGREVAKIARGFGMEVIVHHPRPSAKRMLDTGVKFVDLRYLLQNSDIVSIHAALNSETEGLIGAKELSLMKNTAILLNTARGRIVDETALIAALQRKQIAAAGLDVVIDDPVKKDNPLMHLENAFVMPHMGARTVEAQKRTAEWTVNDILRFIRGEKPEHLVNPEVFKNL